MTTVINNPGNGEGSDSSASVLVVFIVLLIAIVLFFIYGLPAIRDDRNTPQNSSLDINVKLPPAKASDSSTPTAN